MKLLIDENVSYQLVRELRHQDWQVIALVDKSKSLSDDEIYHLACREKAIIITRDYHFTNPVRFPITVNMGVIYLRHGNLTSPEEATIVRRFLNSLQPDEIYGKLVVLSRDSVTIRE